MVTTYFFLQSSKLYSQTNQVDHQSLSNNSKNFFQNVPNQSISDNTNSSEKNDLVSSQDLEIVSLYVIPDKSHYTEFEDMAILAVWSNNQEKGPVKLILEITNSSDDLVYRSSLIPKNTTQQFIVHPPSKPGTYNATITIHYGTTIEQASVTFDVINILQTRLAPYTFLLIGFFLALMLLIIINLRNSLVDEVLRFIFLSGIVLSALASLFFADLQLGSNSPLGLVMNNGEWVFSIGNSIWIPVYVMVFGLLGGYLRYVYKTSRLIYNEITGGADIGISQYNTFASKLDNDYMNSKSFQSSSPSFQNRRQVFYTALNDIMLFILAPLLAIASYFLLHAVGFSGANSVYVIAVISFSVGLTTEEVIQRLIKFSKEWNTSAKPKEPDTSAKPKEPDTSAKPKEPDTSAKPKEPPR
jgi:hypothetical protein